MATLPGGMKTLAVTPSNFEEIIELSKIHCPPDKEPYTEEQLQAIRSQAREKNNVAFIMFMDQSFWNTEESPDQAVHDTGAWREDRR